MFHGPFLSARRPKDTRSSPHVEFIYQGQKGPKVSETNGHNLFLPFLTSPPLRRPPVAIVLRN